MLRLGTMKNLSKIRFLVLGLTLALISGCAVSAMTSKVEALHDEGFRLSEVRDLTAAQRAFEAGIEEAGRLNDEVGLGFTLSGLGNVFRLRKDYEKALEAYQAALPQFVRAKNRVAEA